MGRLRTRTVFADQGLTVSVAESMEFRVDRTERMRLATGALKPIAVIVNGSWLGVATPANTKIPRTT